MLRPGTVVVNKSTVPVGSTRFVQRVLSESGVAHDDVDVASNPEFLREGQAVKDFLNPDRIVIGCERPSAAIRVSDLYRGVQAPVLVTDPASAEMIKYASNAFLATKISFINAIANLCEALDADIREVAIGMGYDERIGFQFLHPGPGYGGSCFPKDVSALLHASRDRRLRLRLARGRRRSEPGPARADRREDRRGRGRCARRCRGRALGPHVQGRDRRPARLALDRCGTAPVRSAAPSCARSIRRRARRPAGWCRNSTSRPIPYEAAQGADVIAVMTEWDEFRWLDFARVRDGMRRPHVVDSRNLLDPAAMRRMGFSYDGVGRR